MEKNREMNRRDTEAQRKDPISEAVIGFCIGIHRRLRPGLLESAYRECLCYAVLHEGTVEAQYSNEEEPAF